MAQAAPGLVKRPVKIFVRRQGELLMEQIFQTTPIRIGRMLDNDLPIPFDFISRYHCELRFENDAWKAVDLGSKNGFLVEDGVEKKVRLERTSELALRDGAHFYIQELHFTIEYLDAMDFTQSFTTGAKARGTVVDEGALIPSNFAQPMVNIDLQNALFVPHPNVASAKERALQVTTVWHDQVLDSKEFAIGAPIEWSWLGYLHDLGRVSRDQSSIRVPKGFKAVPGSEQPSTNSKNASIVASVATPTAFHVNEHTFVYFRYVPKSKELPQAARFIDDRMLDPLMFSTAVHGTVALAALALGGKHAPPEKPATAPERFAQIIMPMPTPVAMETPEPTPVQVVVQPTPESTPEPTPIPEKPKPKKIAKIDPPKPAKVIKEKVRKVAVKKAEDLPPPPAAAPPVAPPPAAAPVVPAPVVAVAPPPPPPPPVFKASSVGALKAFAMLKPGPVVSSLANVDVIQVSRAPVSVAPSTSAPTQATGEILDQLKASSSAATSKDSAGGVAIGGKNAGGAYRIGGTGKAGNRKIKGSVLGGATYTELSKNDGLTRDQVMKEVTKHQSEIQQCYEKSLMLNPDLSGTAEFEWEIAGTGSVNYAKVKGATIKNGEGLLDCVKGVFSKMTFPKAKNSESTNSTISLPFGRL